MGRLEEMEQKLESVTAELEQEKARRLSVETDVADIVKNAIDNNNKENTVPDEVINQVFSEAEAAEADGEGSRRELALAADGDGNHRNLLVSGSWCTMKVLLAGPHWYTVRSLGTTYSNSCFKCPSGYGKYFNDITATKYTLLDITGSASAVDRPKFEYAKSTFAASFVLGISESASI